LQQNIDEILAGKKLRPHLLARAAIQRDDRSFDANEHQA
jgi:hypothetical protein